jgi:hypothetical protein
MMSRRWNRNTWVVLLFGLLLVIGLSTVATVAQEEQEHPEHPEKEQKEAEHPEHPEKEAEHPEHPEHHDTPPTIGEVATFLEGHVAKVTADTDGWMSIRDEKTGQVRELQLDKIHEERLAQTAEHTYFVCADFKSRDGEVFDLDFWVHQTEHGLEVTETMIHKQSGNPRYTWYEESDVWKRKPM